MSGTSTCTEAIPLNPEPFTTFTLHPAPSTPHPPASTLHPPPRTIHRVRHPHPHRIVP
jgi:hypothetical protein